MLKYVGNEKRLMKEDMVRHLGRFGCYEEVLVFLNLKESTLSDCSKFALMC
jgi:hypothetical protein